MIVEKKLISEKGKDMAILYVEGLIKVGESAWFLAKAIKASDLRRKKIILDFGRIDYIDSTGIGELVGTCGTLARKGRKLALSHVSKRIAKLIEVAHLTDVLPIFETEEEAIASFSEPSQGHA